MIYKLKIKIVYYFKIILEDVFKIVKKSYTGFVKTLNIFYLIYLLTCNQKLSYPLMLK